MVLVSAWSEGNVGLGNLAGGGSDRLRTRIESGEDDREHVMRDQLESEPLDPIGGGRSVSY